MQAILGSKTRHLYNRSDCTLKNKRPKSNRSRSPLGLSPSPASSPSPVSAMFVTGRQRDDPDHGLPGSARGMPLLSSQARLLPHAPCSSLPMPPHFPLLGWVCASVCHGGETAPRHRALLPPDSLNFTLRPPPAAAEPPTALPCGLSLPKELFLPGPLRPQPARRGAGPRVPLTHESATGDSVGVLSLPLRDPHRDYSRIIPDQNFLLSTHQGI